MNVGHPSKGYRRIGLSIRSVVLFVVAIAIPMQAEVLRHPTSKKTFFTKDSFFNKAFPSPYKEISMKDQEQCRKACDGRADCFAFAYSFMAEVCALFEEELGAKPIQKFGYKLFISEKTEAQGYYKAKYGYIKLILLRLSAYNAQKFCEIENGKLVAIRDEAMNQIVMNLMNKKMVFTPAHIGVTDAEQEQNWVYYDGTPVSFQGWTQTGTWSRLDKNCATVDIIGEWRHVNCHDRLYFFCEIPYY